MKTTIAAALLVMSSMLWAEPKFEKHQLADVFYSEGANVGDFNHDGKMDVVAGPYWYEGPEFKNRHGYYPAEKIDPHGYSKNFLAFSDDLNHDGWDDILIVGFPGEQAYWFENPKGGDGIWKKHLVHETIGDESPAYADILGNGHRQLVFVADGKFGYAERDADAEEPWNFHAISPKGSWQRFTHGLGVGDINGDGRADLIEKDGWWEQPASLQGDPVWKLHSFNFAEAGAQMFAYDVDGDGKADVVTSLHAHGYGLAWYQQISRNGEISFVKHLIMGTKPEENSQGVVFSQLHAVDLADIDGDGLKDIVTGKRYWAHGPHGDVEPNAPAVLYWFQLKRTPGGAEFIAHKIDDNSGVGTQVIAADANGDGKADVIVGNKKGTFLFLQK